MLVIEEEQAAELVTLERAITAVRDAFIALADGRAELFPVAGGRGTDATNRFAAKSGRLDGVALGVKVGTYWPGNVRTGQLAHASTVLLLDDDTGFPLAVVAASHLTALRTAAADAVAVDALARPDATRLVVMGTGHQAEFDALAIREVRTLVDVAVWGRNRARADALATRLVRAGLPAHVAGADDLRRADIVTTVTATTTPILHRRDLGEGVHISAMGADSPGKHELDVDIVTAARCVADVVAQATTIGELQHATSFGALDPAGITSLGDVLTGRSPGRTGDELTLFDSSGTAVQDLAVCALAVAALQGMR